MSNNKWRLTIAKSPVGANEVFFDLYNPANSGLDLYIDQVFVVVSGAVTIDALLGVDLFLTKTSAVGTGGTAAVANGTSVTASNLTNLGPTNAVPGGISARRLPTGGATAGAVIAPLAVFTDDDGGGTGVGGSTYIEKKFLTEEEMVKLPEGQGIRVVQGAVASLGNIAFSINFGHTMTRSAQA